jgi:hypothetical protein
MTRGEFNTFVENRIYLIKKVLLSKGKEYANDIDVFHNFKAAEGLSFHECPEKVCWEFMVKHLQSIKDILDHVEANGVDGYPTREIVTEKFGDAINYLVLLEGMLEEKQKFYEDLIMLKEKR